MKRLTVADHCYWSASWRPPVDLWRWDHWLHCSTQYPSSHQQDAIRPFRIYQYVDAGGWPPSGFRRWSMAHHYWWAPQTSRNFIFPLLAISNQLTVIFYLCVFLYHDQSFTQSEVIRRFHGSLFLDRFRLSVVPTGYVYVDCRNAKLQYCGVHPLCLAYDERSDDIAKLVSRLYRCELVLAESAAKEKEFFRLIRSIDNRRHLAAQSSSRIFNDLTVLKGWFDLLNSTTHSLRQQLADSQQRVDELESMNST